MDSNLSAASSIRCVCLMAALLAAVSTLETPAQPADLVWAIGKPDGLSIEFAPGARPELTFVIGQNNVSTDFAAHQNGSVGFDGREQETPYRIQFDLAAAAAGPFHLELDLLYKSGAPRQIQVRINDRFGIFPVRIESKKSGYGDEANVMLLAKQRLVVPVQPEWLKLGPNEIAITPLGLGTLEFDALQFKRGLAPDAVAPRLDPTIFYRERGGTLMAVCDLVVPFQTRIERASAEIELGGKRVTHPFTSGRHDFGLLAEAVELPAVTGPQTARVKLDINGTKTKVEHPFVPARRWQLYICPKVHNDVGYTDLQPHVNELDNRNTDQALEIMENFPFYKFNFETSWLVDNYLDCRPPEWQDHFFDLARQNRATINVLYLNLMTGVCSGEELYRALYFTHRLHVERGSSFDFACLTDAPSHSWFLPTLLRDVGVKAFSNGSNQTRAPILHFSNLNEDSPFWWEGINGERVLFWFARSYTQWKRLTGPDFVSTTANYEYLKSTVPQFLVQYVRENYSPDAVMVYGAYVDNAAIPPTGEAELIEQWNSEFAYPRMVVASDAEYFEYIEKNFGGGLPVYRGDCGAYWEDGVASSAAQTTLNRHSQQLLTAGETAHTLGSIFQWKERYPAEDFNDAWKNVMFYDEHTWGAHNSVSQPDREFVTRQWEIKESYATRANLDARTLLARGLNRLSQNVAVTGDTVLVFNWQNWPRTAPLEVELNHGDQLEDLSSKPLLPLDVLLEKDGWKRVRFLAENVPSMGYKGYAIRRPPAAVPSPATRSDGTAIESAYYKLTVDLETGAISSLIDKESGRELLDSSAPYRLNQYVYVTGGEGSLILNHTFGTPPATLVLHPAGPARVIENVRTPFGHRVLVETSCTNAPSIRSEYLLYDQIKRLDISNIVSKVPTRQKEACYFAFPFAALNPEFAYQIQNGWVRPNLDQMPGACREWFTPQNVVHMRDGAFDIAWATPDAPLVCLTDINRGKWLAHLPITNGHVFSYAMHNYWFTNYRAEQGGTLRFRYAITSGQNLDRTALARFDADIRSGLIAYPFFSSFSAGVSGENRPLPASTTSFLNLDTPHLQIVTFKAAEDGNGLILRLLEVGGQAGTARLASPLFAFERAWLCNGVEARQQQLGVDPEGITLPFQPNRYITIRLQAKVR